MTELRDHGDAISIGLLRNSCASPGYRMHVISIGSWRRQQYFTATAAGCRVRIMEEVGSATIHLRAL